MEAPTIQDEAKQLIAAAIDADPIDFEEANAPQDRFYAAIRNPPKDRLTIVPFLKGNGVGGTRGLVTVWGAIMFGTKNPRFQGSPFGKDWPFRKSARIVSTIDSLSDKNQLQTYMKELFPVGKWRQGRANKPYNAEGETDTGWTWDAKTYDQDPLQAAGANKGLILFSEPPPYPIFTECCTRLRGQGLILIDMTQLDMAEWAEDMVDAGCLKLDGKVVGEVRVVRGDIEENCRDHYPPDTNNASKPCGQRTHASIEADIALWPAEEREARKTGRPLHRSGRIYPNWSDANELAAFPPFHQECWDKGRVRIWSATNPHDRLPWPMQWYATFPNDDVIAFAEWPFFTWHECKSSPVTHYEDYRSIILETEAEIGLPIKTRIMDPLFGEAINTQSGFNLFRVMAGKCLECSRRHPKRDTAVQEEQDRVDGKCAHSLLFKHGLAYPGSVNAGHIVLRAAIGDAEKGLRPKFYALKDACANLCYAMRRYAWRENRDATKGSSVKPQLVNKEVSDCPRLGFLSKMDKWPPEAEPLELYKSPYRERNQR